MADYQGGRVGLEDFHHSMARENRVYVDESGTLWVYVDEFPGTPIKFPRASNEQHSLEGDRDRDPSGSKEKERRDRDPSGSKEKERRDRDPSGSKEKERDRGRERDRDKDRDRHQRYLKRWDHGVYDSRRSGDHDAYDSKRRTAFAPEMLPGVIRVPDQFPFLGMWPNFYPTLHGKDSRYGPVVYVLGSPPAADEQGAPPRRLSYYNPSLAATLGPDCVFVGGLPYHYTESQIRELLESVGPLRSFHLVKDRETGNSKGSALCVYEDLSDTAIARITLNRCKMGDKRLTVRRANQGASRRQPEQESVQKLVLQPTAMPTKVLYLTEVVTPDELKDDQDFEDILEDTRVECGKFGNLVNVVIPRPDPSGEDGPGVGKVFLEYADVEGSSRAQQGLNGRKFGGDQVVAVFYTEDKFSEGDYSG